MVIKVPGAGFGEWVSIDFDIITPGLQQSGSLLAEHIDPEEAQTVREALREAGVVPVDILEVRRGLKGDSLL